jgi:hypothetical protein
MKMLLKNFIQLLIIISFAFYFPHISYAQSTPPKSNEPMTVDDLQKKYPDAEIRQVPYDQLEAVKNGGYYDECKSFDSSNPTSKSEALPKGRTDLNDRGPYINFNSVPNFNSGGDKNFLILVAVVGVIVVAFLVIYSVGYLYQTATSKLKCLTWKDFGLRLSSIDDRNKTQFRSGYMSGLYFSTGYRVPIGVMGLLGELGVHSFDLTINRLTPISRNYNGTYLLVGPSFSIPFTSLNKHLFQIELLAGTSNNRDIGLMSTLRFGVSFRVSSQLNIGINAGAALINIKGFGNYLKDSDQLNSLLGTSVSYKW